LRLIPHWLFWICQAAIIPILSFLVASFQQQRITKKYGLDLGPVTPEGRAGSTILELFVVLSGCAVAFMLYKDWTLLARGLFSVGIFFVYGFFVIFLHVSSFETTSKEDLRRKTEVLERNAAEWDKEGIDANDVIIVGMETEISSVSQRVESYTLESALFGALALSGFLTLIASDKPVLNDVRGLLYGFSNAIDNIIRNGFSSLTESPALSASEDNLIAAVALSTLICSMFFFSVIVSRIRFYGVLKQVDHSIRLARAFNDKQETVYNLKLEHQNTPDLFDARLEMLSKRVAEAIDSAQPLLGDLSSIANYMWLFRNSGILAFVFILVTSALLLSNKLALFFISLSTLSYIYLAVDKWLRRKRVQENALLYRLEKRLLGSRRTR
jgi:hypothetical protein